MPGTVIIKPIQANIESKEGSISRFDPYCVAVIGENQAEGEVCKKGGLRPTWNKSFSLSFDDEHYCYLEVKDKRFLKDKIIGVCAIDLEELQLEKKSERWYELYYQQQPVGEILVELQVTEEPEEGTEENRGFGEKGMETERPESSEMFSNLHKELDVMNEKIDRILERSRRMTESTKIEPERITAHSMPKSNFTASQRRFSEDLNERKAGRLRETFQKGKEWVKDEWNSLTGKDKEEERIQENFMYPPDFYGAEKKAKTPSKDKARELKEKMVKGMENVQKGFERKVQSERKGGRNEEFLHEHGSGGRGLRARLFGGVEKLDESLESQEFVSKEVQTDLSFDVTKLFSREKELEMFGDDMGIQEPERIEDKLKLKKEASSEKVEFEAGETPEESIYNLGKGPENLRIALQPPNQEEEMMRRNAEGTIGESDQLRLRRSFDKLKKNMEESRAFPGRQEQNEVEIEEEPYESMSGEVNMFPEGQNLLKSGLMIPKMEISERKEKITITIETGMSSPGGGEVFEELKRRYLPEIGSGIKRESLLENMTENQGEDFGEELGEEEGLIDMVLREGEENVEMEEEPVVEEYQMEVDVERTGGEEVTTTMEHYFLKTVDGNEREELNLCTEKRNLEGGEENVDPNLVAMLVDNVVAECLDQA